MTATDTQLISNVVDEVLRRLGPGAGTTTAGADATSGDGIFERDVDEAVRVAQRAQSQLDEGGLDLREKVCKRIKELTVENADEWARFELNETEVGRLDHKVAKLHLIENVPGVEFMHTAAHSGSDGISLDEAAAWGVIGVITPVTHSIPTMTANAINMIAAGNSMVVNPHPSGAKSCVKAARVFNQTLKREFGLDPLINVIAEPTLETANAIFEHKQVPLLVVTGGPGVARAALQQAKRAIVAGPGNPPVVIDETANLDNAAQSIIQGAAFDNNLLCIGEKEVFAVEAIFNDAMSAMERAGAMRLNAQQIEALTKVAFNWEKDHYAVDKNLVGRDAQALGQAAGFDVPAGVEVLFGETDERNPFVPEEQMMPFVPFVRSRDFSHAMDQAIEHEHGFGHTAIIHSNNLDHITRMGRACNTTIFVANGPCTAGLGIGGEGYPSYSIATPTGEGITNPMTFTRFRRAGVSGALRIV